MGGDMLRCERVDRVLLLTIDVPAARNAVSPDLGRAISSAVAEAAEDDAVGAIVLTGAGSVFSAGGDINGLIASLDRERAEDEERALLAITTAAALALADSPRPTIALVNGACAGGGLALAAACDIRLAGGRAKFAFAYPHIGLGSDLAAAWSLNRVLGPARARHFCLLAPTIDAEEALRIGLVGAVHPDDRLRDEGLALACRLAAMPPLALAQVKANLDAAATLPRAAALAVETDNFIRARASADHREAATAFVEKRAPRFTGR